MSYPCPNCAFGNLQATKITFARHWEGRLVVVPNFAAWRCDSCGYTRYDAAAFARLTVLLGPDEDEWSVPYRHYSQPTEGPGERGPHRWTP